MRRVGSYSLLILVGALALAGAAPPSRRPERPPTLPSASTPPALVAWPQGTRAAPAVVLVREGFVSDEEALDFARRFARAGYVAVVSGAASGKEASKTPTGLAAVAAWLRGEPRVGRRPIAVVGVGPAAVRAWTDPATADEFAAAVSFGGLPEVAPAGRRPTLVHLGAEDPAATPERVARVRSLFASERAESQLYVYPGAGVAFALETRETYHPDAARHAWARTLAFLQRHLGD